MDLTEAVYRSRNTLLNVLAQRGYDSDSITKLGVDQIKAFTIDNYPTNYPGLDFTIKHKESEKEIQVHYGLQGKFTQYQRILNAIQATIEEFPGEHIYMIQDTVSERVHSLVSSHLWFKYKTRVSFFCIYEIVINPLDHVLVPRHEQVPTEEVPELMKRIRITEKSQLPLIRYHTDPIGRLIGLVPGDIVKITRSSPSSGEYILYRACVP